MSDLIKRIIDADAIDWSIVEDEYGKRTDSVVACEILIENQHTIDAVSVVRCKECKHRPIKEDAEGADYGFNISAPNGDERCPCLVEDGWYSWMPNDNFYCGFGERKGE